MQPESPADTGVGAGLDAAQAAWAAYGHNHRPLEHATRAHMHVGLARSWSAPVLAIPR
jgi:hypothetical protein